MVGPLALESAAVVDDELVVDVDEVVRVLEVEVVSSSSSRSNVVVEVLVVVRLVVEVELDLVLVLVLVNVRLPPLLPSQSSPRSQQYPSAVHVPKSGQ